MVDHKGLDLLRLLVVDEEGKPGEIIRKDIEICVSKLVIHSSQSDSHLKRIRDIFLPSSEVCQDYQQFSHTHPFQISPRKPRILSHKSSFIPRMWHLWSTLPFSSASFPESHSLSSSVSFQNLTSCLLPFPSRISQPVFFRFLPESHILSSSVSFQNLTACLLPLPFQNLTYCFLSNPNQ